MVAAILFPAGEYILGHIPVLHHIMNTQFKFGDDRLNGSKVTAFYSKSKMAATAILFQVCHQFLGHKHVLHHIMNTQFKFGDDRLNGSKVTAFCSKSKMAAAAILQATTAILTSLERAYMTS